ncbi:MAG: glycosyltransferase [Acidobacteria bacterium]|nr:glycosyltransferase [Acidobacteriota bacterium]MBI3472536.1 glycosyltransferase [Candidatus Solibacter usitatus]
MKSVYSEVPLPGGSECFLFQFGLSVFFPAFNDARSLPDLLARTFRVLRAHVADYEVIVVNDGSVDDTAQVLEQLRRQYEPHLRVVTHADNRGYGAALRSGFTHARKEFVFYTDGDGQYDPAELLCLLRSVTANTGLVNGYKTERQDPWHRVAIGWLYNQFARRLFRIRLRDIDCDFRLIRKSVLDECELTSTSGTICVELVRRIEMSGVEVVERPVHHYPRLHGRSQFFRVRSLATTFLQLCALFCRLVLLPVWTRATALPNPTSRLTLKPAILICLAIAMLAVLAYARALWLPFIADDYLQIELGRQYGPVPGWGALLGDALYRCRATSLVLTYWTERAFGLDPFFFNLSSLAIHTLNSMLVFALGLWRPIGWRLSAVAACFFAVCQHHAEAVIWDAAIPELLVFTFSLLSFLCWVWWLQAGRGSRTAYWCAFAGFLAALLSKESAVALAPLLLFAGMLEPSRRRVILVRVLPFALCAAAYFGLVYAARSTHLHFNDAGTFSLGAPFVWTLLRSSARLLRVWGAVGLIALVVWKARTWARPLAIAGVWWVLTLLPYCFLTYMPHVPSRHTYFASVGLSLLVAAALIELHARTARRHGMRVAALIAGIIIVHQCAYLWTRKQAQFELRARPTEELLRTVWQATSTVYVKCFPYDPSIAGLAVRIRARDSTGTPIVFGPVAANRADAHDWCFDRDRASPF